MASPAGNGTLSNDERLEYRTIFFDEPVPILVDNDVLVVEPPLETGVLGGDVKVNSWEAKDRFVFWVSGLRTVDIDGILMPKSKSSLLAL